MSCAGGPSIIKNGLVLCLDAADKQSYSGSGTTWRDLALGATGDLINDPIISQLNGGVIILDGINDFVSFASNIPERINTFSNEIWVNVSNLNGGENSWSTLIRMFGRRPDNSSGDFVFTLKSNGSVQCEIRNTADTGYDLFSTATGIIVINQWYHIVQVIDRNAGNLKFYVNGILRLNTSTSNYSIITSSSIQIGQQGTNVSSIYARRLTGKIGGVKLYNKVLTQTEVLQNYNATKGRFQLT